MACIGQAWFLPSGASTPFSNLNLDPSPPCTLFFYLLTGLSAKVIPSHRIFAPAIFSLWNTAPPNLQMASSFSSLTLHINSSERLSLTSLTRSALPQLLSHTIPSLYYYLKSSYFTWFHLSTLERFLSFIALPSLKLHEIKDTAFLVQWRATPRQEVLNKYLLNVNDIIHFQFMIFLKNPKAQTLIKAQISV